MIFSYLLDYIATVNLIYSIELDKQLGLPATN